MARTRERIVDELLVLAAQGGRVDAFERLAARWHPRLLRHAWRLTGDADGAADAAQEAWVAIARGLRRLQDPACFGSWALRITGRRCVDWVSHRQRMRQRYSDLDAAAGVPTPADDRHEAQARVHDVLRGLAPEQRALMAMYYVEDLSVGEIAAVLGVPTGTVKSRLYHARERLRAVLEVSDGAHERG